jgi:hypothetical protein
MGKCIRGGDAKALQMQFTAFLQQNLSLFCAPTHREKVYQAIGFMLIYSLFSNTSNCAYDVKMEQDDGLGRSDITAHPQALADKESFIFELKAVPTHIRKGDKRKLKSINRLRKELYKATVNALDHIEECLYRAKAPHHASTIYEYGLAFAGKFCVVAVRTLSRTADGGDWVEIEQKAADVGVDIQQLDLVVDDEDDDGGGNGDDWQ